MLTPEIRSFLSQWHNPCRLSTGITLEIPQAGITVCSATNTYGWGAHLLPDFDTVSGTWVPGASPFPHQPFRNNGCHQCLSFRAGSTLITNCPHYVRQHCGGALPQNKGTPITRPVQSELAVSTLVRQSPPQCTIQTHSWQTQCLG